MDFILDQSALKRALSLVEKAVPSRPTHPILGCVLCHFEGNQLKLIGFDLSVGIEIKISVKGLANGTIALPSKLLSAIISKLPQEEIRVMVKDEAATLTSSSGKFQVRGVDAKDFPSLPEPSGDRFKIPAFVFAEGLKKTLFAASNDEAKQVLTGVHIKEVEGELEFASTDSHRLAVNRPQHQEGLEVQGLACTIPATALQELWRLTTKIPPDDWIVVHLDKAQVVFESLDYKLTSRILEPRYPPYEQLLPKQFSTLVTVERVPLIRAVELISVLSSGNLDPIKFSLDIDGSLTLSLDAQDVGSAQEKLKAQISGESLDVAFNIKYLLEGLKNIQTKEIQIALNKPNQPVVFSPLGGEKMRYLVMPITLKS